VVADEACACFRLTQQPRRHPKFFFRGFGMWMLPSGRGYRVPAGMGAAQTQQRIITPKGVKIKERAAQQATRPQIDGFYAQFLKPHL